VLDVFTEVIYIHKEKNGTQSCSLGTPDVTLIFSDCTPSIMYMTVCVLDVRKYSIHFKVLH
jgi:hypothetical protein